MIALVREYKGHGECLSVHHPTTPDAKDDAPDASLLAMLVANQAALERYHSRKYLIPHSAVLPTEPSVFVNLAIFALFCSNLPS